MHNKLNKKKCTISTIYRWVNNHLRERFLGAQSPGCQNIELNQYKIQYLIQYEIDSIEKRKRLGSKYQIFSKECIFTGPNINE